MPTMGQPNRGWPDTTPAQSRRDDERENRASSLRVHLRATVQRGKLTRALAEGADPKASGELALRAQQLTGERHRSMLARSLRALIAEAHRPRMIHPRAIIDRRAALDAEAAIMEMIERLGSPSPVQPQGVALLTRILTNADGSSPLYNASEPGTLRRTIRGATAALDAQPARSHEFALAA
jgi:hypothetical protein